MDRYECRLPLATERALELCADLGATATWFCLGDQARRHPELLRRIAAQGHAIALHGLTHRRAFEMDRATWRASVRDGKALLEDLTGCEVVGHRAPEWSLRGIAADWWQELPELGFRYDSSRVPLAVIGNPANPRRPHQLMEGLWELPPPVLWSGPVCMPLWGWGPRALPFSLVRRALEELALEDAGTPLVLHPWELDAEQPRLPGLSLGHRFTHTAGLRGYAGRLRDLLDGFQLTSLESWVEAQ